MTWNQNLRLSCNCFPFSSWPWVSSWISSPSSLTSRRYSWDLAGSTRCIPCIDTGTLLRWSSRLFISWLEPPWGLSSRSRIHLAYRFCSPRRFWAHFPHFIAIQGTTTSYTVYFLASIHEGRRFHNRKNNQEDIAMRISKWPQSVVLFLPGSIPQT